MSAGKNAKRKLRIKQLREIARQSILKFAPEPITPQEIAEYKTTKWFKSLVREISQAMYHAPGATINQRKFDSTPNKSIKQLLIEFEERHNIQTSV